MKSVVLRDWLKSTGVPEPTAEIRARFVDEVLSIYDKAAASLLSPKAWSDFQAKKGALGAAKVVGGVALQYPIEDAITSEIGHIARTIFRDLPADHFLKVQQAQFHFESPVPSNSRAGRHSRKADFLVYTANALALEIAIEAKPVRVAADIKRDYLGADGIGCFFDQDSAYTRGPLGAMWAYTSNPQVQAQAQNISAALRAYKPAPTALASLKNIAFAPVVATQHTRSHLGLAGITIFHIERVFPVVATP